MNINMQPVYDLVELWCDPITGVTLPFVDTKLVAGRLEFPTQINTAVRTEVEGQSALVELIFPWWDGRTSWGEGSPIFDPGQPQTVEIPDTQPLVTVTRRKAQDGRTAVVGAGLIVLGVAMFIHHLARWLRGVP